jgi:hypothetical protein
MKEKSKSLDQLEEVIEEVKKLMMEETQEEINREVWDKRKPVGVAVHKTQQGKGVYG